MSNTVILYFIILHGTIDNCGKTYMLYCNCWIKNWHWIEYVTTIHILDRLQGP